MFMDYMDYKSQEKIIERGFHYSEKFCQHTLYHVALGLRAMHAKGVIHRDIKSNNILSDSSGEIKIADLGLSKSLSSE